MDDKKNPILFSKINTDGNVPLYYQLASIIKRNIAVDIIKPGNKFLSELVFKRYVQ